MLPLRHCEVSDPGFVSLLSLLVLRCTVFALTALAGEALSHRLPTGPSAVGRVVKGIRKRGFICVEVQGLVRRHKWSIAYSMQLCARTIY